MKTGFQAILLSALCAWGASFGSAPISFASENLLSAGEWKFQVGTQEGKLEHSERPGGAEGTELHVAKVGEAGPHDHGWWTHEAGGVEGEIYDYKFEALGSGDTGRFGISAGVEFVSPDGRQLEFKRLASIATGTTAPVTEWKIFTGRFVMPRNADRFRFRFSLDAWVPAKAAFRNVSVTRTAVPLADLLKSTPESIPVFEIPLGPVTASGVTLTPDWNLDGAETERSRARQEISLNGLWAIQPATVGSDSVVATKPPQAGDWAFFKVPGFHHEMKPFIIYGQDKTSWAGQDITAKARVIWYARDVVLPPVATGIKVFLTFTGMRGMSVVAYWNGHRVGTLTDQLGGRIDLTKAIGANSGSSPIRGQLVLHALATISETKYAYLMEAGAMARQYDPKDFDREKSRGFTDVYLDFEPAAPLLSAKQLQVIPFFRDKKLQILIAEPLADILKAATYTYSATVRDLSGQVVLLQENLKATPHAKTGKLAIEFPWADPRLWTPEDPNLYTITITAEDAAKKLVDESLHIRFGFREIWVDGKNLILNGQPLRLRPRLLYTPMLDGDSLRRQFSFMKDMGFNSTLRAGVGDVHEYEKNGIQSIEEYYRIADEMGIMVIPFGPHSLSTVQREFGPDGMSEADQDHLFDYMNRHMVEPLANHPSVIGWSGFGSGANFAEGVNSVSTDPEIWGITPLAKEGVLDKAMSDPANRAEAMKRLNAASAFVQRLKQLDPSRPYFAHFDGGSGDVWGIWSYFNWTPVQEWEQWPEAWSKKGTMPIGATEHGFPYASSFLNHGLPDGNFEPWVTEYAAIDLGPDIFANDTPKYLDIIRNAYIPRSRGYTAKSGAHHKFADEALSANSSKVQAVWAYRNRPIYRSWRTYGVTNGIEPFGRSEQFYRGSLVNRDNGKVVANPSQDLRTTGFKLDRWNRTDYWPAETMPWLSKTPIGQKPEGLTALGDVLYEVNRPLLVYIAGAPDRLASKDHVFWGGEKITKQIAAIWDGFAPRSLRIKWKAVLNDPDKPQSPRALGDGTLQSELKGGDIQLLPISWETPSVPNRTEGQVEIEVSDAGTEKIIATDSFAFTLYPENKGHLSERLSKARIVVLDPAGDASESLAALRKAGLSPQVITRAADWKEGDLLVVGKGALPSLSGPSGEPATTLPPQVPVFVMEQTSKALETLGFRVYPMRHRAVFPTDLSNPILSGIAPSDLRDWRVSPTLLPTSTAPLRDGYLYHTNYDGTLVSVSIETPTRGAFTPFLQCGFDLRETPVLETAYLGQRWIFSQLSLTDALATEGNHPLDPVATRLLLNLFDNILAHPTPHAMASSVGVAGGEADAAILRDLGASDKAIRPVRTAAELAPLQLALIGDLKGSASVDAQSLRAWVSKGGTAVILPQSDKSVYSALSPSLRVKSATVNQVPIPGGGTGIFEGLGQGNFHYRQPLPQLIFADGSNVTEVRDDAGRWVFLGFDPRTIDLDKQPYLSISYRNQSRALSQILSNLGVPLETPVSAVLHSVLQAPLHIDIGKTGVARVQAESGAKDWKPFGLASQTIAAGNALVEIKFLAPEKIPAGALIAALGTIDDYDETSLNGQRIGSVTPENSHPDTAWKTLRLYPIPSGLLRPGENTLSLHVWNRNAAKGSPAIIRGPMEIRFAEDTVSPYVGTYQRSDDPYLQRMW